MTLRSIKTLFLVGAIYDIVLGVAFGLFFKPFYTMCGVELPNHAGYIQLAAVYIFTFGIGFYFVYRDPQQNRAIVPLGILMKLGFCLVAFGHLLFGTLPSLYIPFAVLDLVFLALFVAAHRALKGAVA